MLLLHCRQGKQLSTGQGFKDPVMKNSKHLVAITRNQEFICECGLHAEKIGYLVAMEDGTVNHYGSECIKKVLKGFSTKGHKLTKKQYCETLKIEKVFWVKDGASENCGYCLLPNGKKVHFWIDRLLGSGERETNPEVNLHTMTYNYIY